jgi:hypothetical protein
MNETSNVLLLTAAPSAGSTPRRWDRSEAPSGSNESRQGDSDFVVHRGKTVPTLHHVTAADGATPRLRAKEKFNTDTKAEERGEDQPAAGRSSAHGPAGVPSNWEDRKQTYAGRRSRRNSITDDSHLTIENFGGSQDNLSLLGRNPDKEPVTLAHSGRRPSIDSGSHFGDMPTAGTPSGVSSAAAATFWKRNNERTRSQVIKFQNSPKFFKIFNKIHQNFSKNYQYSPKFSKFFLKFFKISKNFQNILQNFLKFSKIF